MKGPKFRYPAAVVVWLDAHSRNQAVEYEESEVSSLHRPEECMILGLVMQDDETGVSLYNEETGPSSVRGLGFIPRAMIKDIFYVNLTPPRSAVRKRTAVSSANTSPSTNPIKPEN